MSASKICENRKEIIITISHSGLETVVRTYANAYRNLMVLLNNTIYLESFGECGGQGRCATCLVKISGSDLLKNQMTRNERSTLDKMQLSGTDIRLACQFLISEALDGSVIEIIVEGY